MTTETETLLKDGRDVAFWGFHDVWLDPDRDFDAPARAVRHWRDGRPRSRNTPHADRGGELLAAMTGFLRALDLDAR